MNNSIANFLLGLLCTGGLFILCFLVVVGAKMVTLSFKEKFIHKSPPQPKATVIKRQKRTPSPPKPVRSIEIDPEQVDRIYVKKIS